MNTTKQFNYKVVLPAFLATVAMFCVLMFLWSRPAIAQVTNTPPGQGLLPGQSQGPLYLMSPGERAHYAIMEPQAYCAELAKYKTAAQLEIEEEATFAITQPAAYCAVFDQVKTPERLQLEANAALAILNPEVYNAEVAKQKTAAQLQEEAAAAFAIQHPQLSQSPE
jgi:hypothetical protein